MTRTSNRVGTTSGRRNAGRRNAGRLGERRIAHPESLETRMAPSETLSSLLAAHLADSRLGRSEPGLVDCPVLERRLGGQLSAESVWQVNFSQVAQRLWARSADAGLDEWRGWSDRESVERPAGDHHVGPHGRAGWESFALGRSPITGPLSDSLLNVWLTSGDLSGGNGDGGGGSMVEPVSSTSQTRAPAGGGSTSGNQLSASPAAPPAPSDAASDTPSTQANTADETATSAGSKGPVERGDGESPGRKEAPGDSSPPDNTPVTNPPGVDWVDVALNLHSEQSGTSEATGTPGTSSSPAAIDAAITALTQTMLTSPRGGEELERELFAKYGRERREGVGHGQQKPGRGDALQATTGTGTGTGSCSGSSSTSGVNNSAPVAVADTPYFSAIGSVNTRPLRNNGLHNSVLTNDYDCDGSKLTASLYAKPTKGTATMQPDGTFVYTPNAGHSGVDVLWYRAYDGKYLSSPAPVTIYTIGADIDADSNNSYGLERNTIEDNAEMVAPGKVLIDGRRQDNGSLRTPVAVSLMGAEQLSTADLPQWTARIVPPANAAATADYFQFDTGIAKPLTTIPTSDMLNRMLYNNPQLFYVQQAPGWVGTTNYNLQLLTPQNTLFHTDSLLFTGIKMPGLKAFRQQTKSSAGTLYDSPHYEMFHRREIPAEDVTSIGVGIRPNRDYHIESVDREDDLVEIRLTDIVNPGIGVRATRSDDKFLRLWEKHNPGDAEKDLFVKYGTVTGSKDNVTTNDISGPVSTTNGTLWVEWADLTELGVASQPPTSNLGFEIYAKNTNQTLASISPTTFYRFQSIVVVNAGEFQVPDDTPGASLPGIFKIATSLYQSGYDVYMYDEPDLVTGPRTSDEAMSEVKLALNGRDVGQVAILGYSHGGGMVYQMSTILDNWRRDGIVSNNWQLALTGYVDAINWYSIGAENRRPVGSDWHVSIYQQNNTPSGGPSGGDIDIDFSFSGLKHTDIDDSATVQSVMIGQVRNNVSR